MDANCASAEAFRFAGFTLDLARGVLLAAGGAEVPLRPKSMALLRLLVANAGRLLSRDAIMAAIWPEVVVTDQSITQCVRDIRQALGDETQQLLRTVPKGGYLLAAEVTASATVAGDWPLSARPPPPDKPSIAVLPFQNLSGDPSQDYYADGVVEDVTTELARVRWLFVIARNSSFAYRDRPHDVTTDRPASSACAMSWKAAFAGSASRVRITAQLIDAASGGHLWADRFDGELADIFEVQDRLTASVVGSIAPRLEEAEIERVKRKPTESLCAYDYFLRGMAAFHRFTPADNADAAAQFAKAIGLDRDFAAAYGMAARCHLQRKAFGWNAITSSDVAEAERLARRAAELGREDAVALGAAAGALLTVCGEVEDGAALVDRATALNPNLAWLWNYSAYARLFLGEPETAIAHAARAMRLSPHDPQMFGMQAAIAFGHFFAGDYLEALSWAEAAIRQQPNFLVATCIAAASGMLAGKTGEATQAMARVRRLSPALRLSNLKDLLPFRRPQDFGRWREALRRAGLPD